MGETGSSGALSEGFAWDLVSLTTPCPCSRSVESSHELKTYLQFSCGPSKKKKKGRKFSEILCFAREPDVFQRADDSS